MTTTTTTTMMMMMTTPGNKDNKARDKRRWGILPSLSPTYHQRTGVALVLPESIRDHDPEQFEHVVQQLHQRSHDDGLASQPALRQGHEPRQQCDAELLDGQLVEAERLRQQPVLVLFRGRRGARPLAWGAGRLVTDTESYVTLVKITGIMYSHSESFETKEIFRWLLRSERSSSSYFASMQLDHNASRAWNHNALRHLTL